MASTSLDSMDKQLATKVTEYFKSHGVAGVKKFIKRHLDGWREAEVHIGITGESGTGKSSFINAIRGLRPSDDGGAAVDVVECTTQPTPYKHPTNSKITLWDFPGLGTPNFPDLETYFKIKGLEKCRVFLIFAATRFTNNDLQLARKLESANKNFFFVRTKIDAAVEDKRRDSKVFNEDVVEAMLESIRSDISKHLGNLLTREEDIYLIGNPCPSKWDFDRLIDDIIEVLPVYQRESVSLTLMNLSAATVERKVKTLKGRIWIVAVGSAIAGAVPIPGLSVAVDMALIIHEVNLYKSQLGLREQESSELYDVTTMLKKVGEKCLTTTSQISTFLAANLSESAAEEFTRFAIPFVGLGIAACLSFAATYYTLNHCLQKEEELALKVLREASKQ